MKKLKPLILIVDDNVDNISVIEEILKEFNFDFNSITDSTIILDVLEYKVPDLILLDYFMPEQDGLETLKIIKSNPLYSQIPVIILTADSEKETLATFMKNGAIDYLNKPVNYIELEARISSVLKITHLTKELAEKVKLIKKQNDEIDMFTEMMVNELKAPLANALKFSRIIQTDTSGSIDKIKECARLISKSCQEVSLKIDNVMDVVGSVKAIEKIQA